MRPFWMPSLQDRTSTVFVDLAVIRLQNILATNLKHLILRDDDRPLNLLVAHQSSSHFSQFYSY
jgi:hypothetical protein